jgi:hypothetical protein
MRNSEQKKRENDLRINLKKKQVKVGVRLLGDTRRIFKKRYPGIGEWPAVLLPFFRFKTVLPDGLDQFASRNAYENYYASKSERGRIM